jgi:hypothetical protein
VAKPGDLRDEKFCQELVARAIEGLGGLDIPVSNAGRQQAHQYLFIFDRAPQPFDENIVHEATASRREQSNGVFAWDNVDVDALRLLPSATSGGGSQQSSAHCARISATCVTGSRISCWRRTAPTAYVASSVSTQARVSADVMVTGIRPLALNRDLYASIFHRFAQSCADLTVTGGILAGWHRADARPGTSRRPVQAPGKMVRAATNSGRVLLSSSSRARAHVDPRAAAGLVGAIVDWIHKTAMTLIGIEGPREDLMIPSAPQP